MLLTPDTLKAATGCTQERADLYAPLLSDACGFYKINTPDRLAAFLAQIGHESVSLKYSKEIWGPTPAQQRYEGRKDLGNTQPGDGERYKGHGLIQTTGRFNHAAVRDRLRKHFGSAVPDFEADPEKLAEPKWAAWSAADYWDWKGLNELADRGDFKLITLRINGGQNGAADRERRWEIARQVLGVSGNKPAPIETIYIPKESEMPLPLVAKLVIPALLNAVPDLVRMWGKDGEKAERQAQTVEKVLEVAKAATGAQNEQALAEIISADPQAAQAVREAVQANWFDIFKAHEESVDRARRYADENAQMKDVRTVVGRFTFIEFLTLVLIFSSWISIGLLAWAGKITESTLDNIVMIAAVATIVGAREFWMGSSFGSRQKDDMRTQEKV